MKVLVVFALALAYASGSALRAEEGAVQNGPGGRIVNGEKAELWQFDYQVGLYVKNDKTYSWCGGAFLEHAWVLTAAHCVDEIEYVELQFGAIRRFVSQIKRYAYPANILIHSGYNRKTMANDIALIRVSDVQYSSAIYPIRLPSLEPPYASYVDEEAVATGWGRTSDSDKYNSEDLMYAHMKVISNAACIKTYGASIESSNICVATLAGASTCGGDDGGPLALESSTPTLIGIASFGSPEGCEKGYPVAFTRVTNYLDWIKAETGITY